MKMTDIPQSEYTWHGWIRRVAIVLSLAAGVSIILIAVSAGLCNKSTNGLPVMENVWQLYCLYGLVVGGSILVIGATAWRWPLAGGIISVLLPSLIILYMMSHDWSRPPQFKLLFLAIHFDGLNIDLTIPALLVLFITGILYLIDWRLEKGRRSVCDNTRTDRSKHLAS